MIKKKRNNLFSMSQDQKQQVQSIQSMIQKQSPNVVAHRRYNVYGLDKMLMQSLHFSEQNESQMSLIKQRHLEREQKKNFHKLNRAQQFELAIQVLKKKDRNKLDLQTLIQTTQTVKFFHEIDEATHTKICKVMRHESKEAKQTVFSIGEAGSKFYIILKGAVDIFITVENNQDQHAQDEEKLHAQLQNVNTLVAGSSFGEQALIEKRPRNATVICREDCTFAILRQRDFRKILRNNATEIQFNDVNFLKQVKIFDQWSFQALRKLHYFFSQRKEFAFNQVVYMDGDESQKFYIVRSGQFKVSIPIRVPPKSLFSSNSKHQNDNNQFAILQKDKNLTKVYCDAALITQQQFFGELELYHKLPVRLSKVTCHSLSGELQIIDTKDFLSYIMSNKSSGQFLSQYFVMQKNVRQQLIENFIQIQAFPQNLQHQIQISDQFASDDFRNANMEQTIENNNQKFQYCPLNEKNTQQCQSQLDQPSQDKNKQTVNDLIKKAKQATSLQFIKMEHRQNIGELQIKRKKDHHEISYLAMTKNMQTAFDQQLDNFMATKEKTLKNALHDKKFFHSKIIDSIMNESNIQISRQQTSNIQQIFYSRKLKNQILERQQRLCPLAHHLSNKKQTIFYKKLFAPNQIDSVVNKDQLIKSSGEYAPTGSTQKNQLRLLTQKINNIIVQQNYQNKLLSRSQDQINESHDIHNSYVLSAQKPDAKKFKNIQARVINVTDYAKIKPMCFVQKQQKNRNNQSCNYNRKNILSSLSCIDYCNISNDEENKTQNNIMYIKSLQPSQ